MARSGPRIYQTVSCRSDRNTGVCAAAIWCRTTWIYVRDVSSICVDSRYLQTKLKPASARLAGAALLLHFVLFSSYAPAACASAMALPRDSLAAPARTSVARYIAR
eukprot:scaffold8098_cov3563-Prasinococcus_capsulatus_cf.AAC.1